MLPGRLRRPIDSATAAPGADGLAGGPGFLDGGASELARRRREGSLHRRHLAGLLHALQQRVEFGRERVERDRLRPDERPVLVDRDQHGEWLFMPGDRERSLARNAIEHLPEAVLRLAGRYARCIERGKWALAVSGGHVAPDGREGS